LEPVECSVAALYALLGLLVGAVLNLAADRLPQRDSILSLAQCPYCQGEWALVDNVSLLALLLRRGRCPHCGAPHPWRRPILELVTVLTFAFFWLRYGPSVQLVLITLYTCILFLVFVIDLEHRLILRVVIFPAIGIAILGSLVYPGLGVRRALLGGAFSFLLFFAIVVFGRLAFGRTAMGGGDANLAAFIGLITGFPEVILALLITVLLGGAVSVILVLGRAKKLKSYIPYGVFLVAGGLAVLVFGQAILAWYFFSY
jgi:leader peptidase (prepilin peptidase)/N-methyltransferase